MIGLTALQFLGLITVVSTVVVAITYPHCQNAVSIRTAKLLRVTCTNLILCGKRQREYYIVIPGST